MAVKRKKKAAKAKKKSKAKGKKKAARGVAKKKATRKRATKKKATKRATRKKATKKKAKSKKKRKANPAFMKPLTPSADLAAIVGAKPLPRTEVVKKLWAYIKKNGLQDAKNRRNINADDKLGPVFGGKRTVSMFQMTALVSKHLT